MGNAARDREDEVITSFERHLRVWGTPGTVLERSDRQASRVPGLTTDALFEVNTTVGIEVWAVDHTVMALPGESVPVFDAIHTHVEPVAHAKSVTLRLSGDLPPAGEVKRLAKALASAIDRSPDAGAMELNDGFEAEWTRTTDNDAAAVSLNVNLGFGSGDVSEQVEQTLGPLLTKKARDQGEPARQAGIRYVILLDWEGHENVRQGTHWLPQDTYTIRLAVNRILQGMPVKPDAIYLLRRDGEWVRLLPS